MKAKGCPLPPGSAENGKSTTHGWRSSGFPPGTALWTQTRRAMSTYAGEVLSGALQGLGMCTCQQPEVAWLGKAALHTVDIPRAMWCPLLD